jgi:chromate reductase
MNAYDNHPVIHVLAFAGSLRKGSYNKALLRAAEELAPESLSIEIFDLEGIPLFNADVEAEGDPERVTQFKEAIRSADAVLVATPEYNYGASGVSKNAVDWASRPPKDSPLDKKPVGIIGASPGITGTARAQSQLRQAFQYTNSRTMPQPEVLVFRAREKFDEQGKLIHDGTRDFLGAFLEKFYEWTLDVGAPVKSSEL